MSRFLTVAFALLLFGIVNTAPVWADVVWDESVDGDLADFSAIPTQLFFPFANNEVIGTIGSVGQDFDDFFTFTIASDQQLDGAILLFYDPDLSGTGNETSIIELNEGPTFPVVGANDLGDALFQTDLIGTNILPTGTLGPGTYTIRIGEGNGIADYQLSFNVSTIPEPSTLGFLSTAAVVCGFRRRRSVC